MTALRPRLRALASDRRGATLLEFAFVAPVMMLMITGFADACYRGYVTATLQGAVQKVGRDSTLETASANLAAIDGKLETIVKKVSNNATFTWQRKVFKSFANVGELEDYTDANTNGAYDVGECYVDVNENSVRDGGGKDGPGGARDVVLLTVEARYPRIFPMAGLLGWPSYQQVTASTVLRNQPYGDMSAAPVVCT